MWKVHVVVFVDSGFWDGPGLGGEQLLRFSRRESACQVDLA